MSEERNPPLKLRSRTRPDAAAAPASTAPSSDEAKVTGGSASTEATEEKGVTQEKELRLRTKPRLSVETAAAAAQSEPVPATPPPPASVPAPVLFVDVPTAAVSGLDTPVAPTPAMDATAAQALADLQSPAAIAPSLLPLPPGTSVPTLPPTEAADAITAAALFSPPPSPLIGAITVEPIAVPQPKTSVFKSFPPKPVHIRLADRDDKPPTPPPAVRPQDRKAFKVGIATVGVFAVIALGVGGYFAFKTFQDLRSPFSEKKSVTAAAESKSTSAQGAAAAKIAPESPQATSQTTDSTPPVAQQLPAAPASQAGRLIQAARNATTPAQTELDEVLSAGDAPPPTALPAATASEHELPMPVLPSNVPEITPAFLAFANSLRINGVFQGAPARAHINGRTVRSGAILDGVLGVVFAGIDVTTREVILQDPSGAVIRKKY